MSDGAVGLEQEEILRAYDSAIMKRILKYLKPHLPVFLLSVAALLFAVVGEVVLPVLIQKSVDNYILPYHLPGIIGS